MEEVFLFRMSSCTLLPAHIYCYFKLFRCLVLCSNFLLGRRHFTSMGEKFAKLCIRVVSRALDTTFALLDLSIVGSFGKLNGRGRSCSARVEHVTCLFVQMLWDDLRISLLFYLSLTDQSISPHLCGCRQCD